MFFCVCNTAFIRTFKHRLKKLLLAASAADVMPGLGLEPRDIAVDAILLGVDDSDERIAVGNGVVGRRGRLSKKRLVHAVDRVAWKHASRRVFHPLDAVGKAHARTLGRHKSVEKKEPVVVALGVVSDDHENPRLAEMFIDELSEPGPTVFFKGLSLFDLVGWNLVRHTLLGCFPRRRLHVALEFIHRDPALGGINNGNGACKGQSGGVWQKGLCDWGTYRVP